MFFGDEGVWTTIRKIHRSGTNLDTILGAGKNVLASLSLSRDGRTGAMVSDTPTHPREVFTMKHGDAGPRRLTNSNPWLDDIRLAKQEVITHRARDGLELHGLQPAEVAGILETGRLLQGITVAAPPFPENVHEGEADHPYHVQRLDVKPRHHVATGDLLCVLADHHELFLEGGAFELDIERLQRAARENWRISAVRVTDDGRREQLERLEIFYFADVVERDSRAFHFYLRIFVAPLGSLLSGNKGAYRYLAESASRFYSPGEIREMLLKVGFRDVSYYPLFFGAAGIHVATK